MRYRFAGFELDADRFELRRGRVRVPIEPKPLQLLLVLASQPERTVAAEELRAALWPDVAVGRASLHRAVGAARRALAAAGGDPKLLPAVRGRGYRLAAAIEQLPSASSRKRADGDPFVGRQGELRALERALAAAAGGAGRIVLLSGEPGIGKTRLARELESRARSSGAQVLWGRAWDGGEAPPYWPWRQLVRAYAGECTAERLRAELGPGAADLALAIPELCERLGAIEPPAPLDPAQARFRLFDSATRFLARAAQGRPWLLLLDDLHAADAPSILLLRYLGREIGALRLLVLATYRTSEVTAHPALARALDALRREPACEELALGALSEAESRRLIARLCRRRTGAALRRSIVARADGNPFFLRELVRELAGGEPDAADASRREPRVPVSVRQMIALRVAGLSARARETLAAAAVLGPRFRVAALGRGKAAERGLLTALSEAEAVGLVSAGPERPGELRFVHSLVSDAIYADLSLAERTRLHRRAGIALEALGAHEAPLAELARHFFAAAASGDLARAVDYSVRAAQEAAAALAFEDAARHYARALEALAIGSPGDDTRRCTLLLRLAEAQERAGDGAEAVRTRKQALELARSKRLGELFAEAACTLATESVLEAAEAAARRAALEEALAGVGGADVALRVRVLDGLRRLLSWGGSLELRQSLHAEAVAGARRSRDRAALLAAYSTDPSLQLSGDAPEDWQKLEEWCALARELRDGEREGMVRILRLHHQIVHADPAAIERELADFDRFVERVRPPRYRYWAAAAHAARALWRGPLDEAERLVTAAHAIGRRLDEQAAVHTTWSAQLTQLRHLRGRFAEALELVRAGAEQHAMVGAFGASLPFLLVDAGQVAEARAAFEPLADRFEPDLPPDPSHAVSLAMLAEACVKLGDTERAPRLYELLLPHAGRYVAVYASLTHGCASRYLGQLAALLGRPDEAARHFEEALDVERRLEARPWLALTELDYARFLRAQGDLSARRHAATAARLASAAGMPHVVASAARVGGAPPRRPSVRIAG